jgi:hypothetical protein
MHLIPLLFTAILVAAPVAAQQGSASTAQETASAQQDGNRAKAQDGAELNLPVSLDKIRDGLRQTPTLSLRSIDERPIFRMQIHERQKIEELLASLNFKTGPVPAGGVYMADQQRLMFNPVDHPLMQPYAAFGSNELLTILIENLVGKYLGGKMVDGVSKAERARAEEAAREEVTTAVTQYCSAQPNGGAGLQICSSARR